jgi:predicted DNA binding CopG/RHH family protein
MAKRRKFQNEDEEREYWATRDSVDEIDWSKATRTTLANLKPSVRTISLRLPESMLEAIKNLANKQDVPYQSLIKVFLADRIEGELHKSFAPRRAARQRRNKALRPSRASRALRSRG